MELEKICGASNRAFQYHLDMSNLVLSCKLPKKIGGHITFYKKKILELFSQKKKINMRTASSNHRWTEVAGMKLKVRIQCGQI